MPPPTATLRPEPIRAGAKKDASATVASSSKAAGANGDKMARPDQTAYNAEQDQLNKEIGVLREEMNEIKSRLDLLHNPKNSSTTKTNGDASAPTDRRSQIKAEMDELQRVQGSGKADRSKTLDAIKRHQDSINTKSKEITSIRQKLPYKNSIEIQSRIQQLDGQIESGKLKLIDEKKALNEISTLKRSSKQVTTLESLETSIAEDKQQIETLRQVLDDPQAKATQARWDALKKEMDQLREEQKKAYDERGGLFDRRNELSRKMDELYERKRASNAKHRADNDAYRAKVDAERKAKNDRFRAERAAEDSARRDEQIQRMREEAKEPAFGREIEDCGVLIGWFERQYGSGESQQQQQQGGVLGAIKGAIDGIKSLDLRKVEEAQPEGTVLKKDRDDTEGWGAFAGTGGKKKGKGGYKKTAVPAATAATESAAPAASVSNNNISLPFSTLNTLLGFGISPPANKDDVPRVIEDLSTKKSWFEANQKRKTEEEVERVEKQINKMLKKSGGAGAGEGAEDEGVEVEGKETGGEREPNHTVAVTGDATKDVSVEQGEQLPETPEERSSSVHQIDQELEQVKSEEEA